MIRCDVGRAAKEAAFKQEEAARLAAEEAAVKRKAAKEAARKQQAPTNKRRGSTQQAVASGEPHAIGARIRAFGDCNSSGNAHATHGGGDDL